MSDTQVATVISKGFPNLGMPAFQLLGQSRINDIVAFVRTLQGSGPVTSVHGDAHEGKALFFGKAACAECHTISGKGGFLAPDLSSYARSHSVSDIRTAIIEPEHSSAANKTVTVTTRDGATVSGVARNEDNFSLQLIDKEGKFHFFSKSDLQDVKRGGASSTGLGNTLSADEINHVISYLQSVSASTKGEARAEDEE
jgi:cytochrome c oxidase cbb3-type subunit III